MKSRVSGKIVWFLEEDCLTDKRGDCSYCHFMLSGQAEHLLLLPFVYKRGKNVWSLASPHCSLGVDFGL